MGLMTKKLSHAYLFLGGENACDNQQIVTCAAFAAREHKYK